MPRCCSVVTGIWHNGWVMDGHVGPHSAKHSTHVARVGTELWAPSEIGRARRQDKSCRLAASVRICHVLVLLSSDWEILGPTIQGHGGFMLLDLFLSNFLQAAARAHQAHRTHQNPPRPLEPGCLAGALADDVVGYMQQSSTGLVLTSTPSSEAGGRCQSQRGLSSQG